MNTRHREWRYLESSSQGRSSCWLAAPQAEDTSPKSAEPESLPTIARKTAGTQAMPGFFPCSWDAKEGKLWLEIGRFDKDFLYVESLAAGVGSNDIGLDRGQLAAVMWSASPAWDRRSFDRAQPAVPRGQRQRG